MNTPAFTQTIRTQLELGDIELALGNLQTVLRATSSKHLNEVVLQTARYNRLRRDARSGVITQETAQVLENKLIADLLQLLDILDRSDVVLQQPTLTSSVVESSIPDDVDLEKIIGVNNLKQIAWLERGLKVASSVCRVIVEGGGFGSGFLIAPDLMMTNNHVIPNAAVAARAQVEFNYELRLDQNEKLTQRYRLDNSRFRTSVVLDYTIVGVVVEANQAPLSQWGYLALNPSADPVAGEHVSIIQHPNGGPKQIVLTANQVIGRWEHRLHYTTDTMPGSSGSPVFNDSWEVIAIHHGGGDLQVNAKGDKRFVNEGILMSAIKPDAGDLWPGS